LVDNTHCMTKNFKIGKSQTLDWRGLLRFIHPFDKLWQMKEVPDMS